MSDEGLLRIHLSILGADIVSEAQTTFQSLYILWDDIVDLHAVGNLPVVHDLAIFEIHSIY